MILLEIKKAELKREQDRVMKLVKEEFMPIAKNFIDKLRAILVT